MKALSVRQPWASQIATEEKSIELRTWTTRYRGDLLICASARSHANLPTGCALCIVSLVDIRPAISRDARLACCEIEHGDFAWILQNVRPIEPFSVKGRLGLFDVELPRIAATPICDDIRISNLLPA